MTILDTRIQSLARQTIQDRLQNVDEKKVTNNDVNVQTKEAVDEVSLTVVNSVSGFDKYVSTLENGKKSVAESFVNTLENYIGDFAKGIMSATK